MQLNLTDKEEINSERKDLIEDLKEISAQGGGCFIVFDKTHVTLKLEIDEVKMKMPELECYYKVDVKINDQIESENIICMLKNIPKHFAIRLEADYIGQIIELMKSKTLIEKLKKSNNKVFVQRFWNRAKNNQEQNGWKRFKKWSEKNRSKESQIKYGLW